MGTLYSLLLVQQMLTLVMFCAPLYMIFFGEKGGRKIPYAVVMCITGISLFAISKAGIDNMPLLYGATLMVGWTIFAHQNFCTVYQAELFPTKVRGMVIGISNIFTKSGTIMTQGVIAPALYGAFGFKGYFLVLAAVYILMSIFILLIAPRTAGLSLEALNECE